MLCYAVPLGTEVQGQRSPSPDGHMCHMWEPVARLGGPVGTRWGIPFMPRPRPSATCTASKSGTDPSAVVVCRSAPGQMFCGAIGGSVVCAVCAVCPPSPARAGCPPPQPRLRRAAWRAPSRQSRERPCDLEFAGIRLRTEKLPVCSGQTEKLATRLRLS